MTTPYWDRTLLGAGGGRKTAEVQRSRSSVGASSSSTPASPSRRSSGYSPKPYKKRSQRVLLHDLSDPTSLPSQLAAAQQAAAAAGQGSSGRGRSVAARIGAFGGLAVFQMSPACGTQQSWLLATTGVAAG